MVLIMIFEFGYILGIREIWC